MRPAYIASICCSCLGFLLSISFVGRALADGLAYRTFYVYSKTGDEVIHGDCAPKGEADMVVMCNFIDMRLTPPKPLSDDDALMLSEMKYVQQPTPAQLAGLKDHLRRRIDKSKQSLQKQKTEEPDSVPLTEETIKEDRQTLDELEKNPAKFIEESKKDFPQVSPQDPALNARLNDPAAGPKTKAFLGQLVAAMSAKDFVGLIELSQARQLRTCGAFMTTFSIEFKRLGKLKWLSRGEPEGLCKIVRVYELEQDPSSASLWTLTQRNIATGDTDDSLCKQFAKAEEETPVEVFSWKNNAQFELPCDWVDWSSP